MVVFVGDYCEGYYENMAVRNHQQSVVEIRRGKKTCNSFLFSAILSKPVLGGTTINQGHR